MKEKARSLPKSWISGTIDQVCTHPQYGWTCKAQASGELKLLRTTDITSGNIDWMTVPFCSETPKNEADYHLQDGDILVSRAGSVGKSYIINGKVPKAVFASYLVRFKPHIERNFVYYFMQSRFYWSQIEDQSAGIAVPNVNGSKLAKIVLPIAPLNEQKRIVDKIERLFSDLDEGEALLKTVQKQLATYRQSVLKAAVTGELTKEWRASNFSSKIAVISSKATKTKQQIEAEANGFPLIPDGWSWMALGDLICDGPSNGISPKEAENGTKSFKLSATTGGEFLINEQTVKFVDFAPEPTSKYWLKSGDILIQRGNTIEYVGVAAIFPGPDRAYIYPDLMMRIRVNDPNLAKWIVLWVNSGYVRKYYKANATGTAGNMPKINGDTLRGIPVPVPWEGELPHLLSKIEEANLSLNRLAVAVNEQIDRSLSLRQSILKSAFSGKLVPQDPTDEPASELLKRIQAERAKKSVPAVSARRGRKAKKSGAA